MMARRLDEAIGLIDSLPTRAQESSVLPRSGLNHFADGWHHGFLGVAARAKGDTAKATQAFEICRDQLRLWLRQRPEEAEALGWLAIAHAGLGAISETLNAAEQATAAWPFTRDPLAAASVQAHVAVAYSWIGKSDLAIAALQEVATRPGEPSAGELRLDPCWDDLRGDPRFADLVRTAEAPVKIRDL